MRGLHTVLGSLCPGGGVLPTPWPCRSNVRHAGQTLSPAGARVRRSPVPFPPGLGQSTSDPALQQKAGVQLLQPVGTGWVPSAAQGGGGRPPSHVAAVGSARPRLVQHLGSCAVRGGLEPRPSRLPPAPGPDCHVPRGALGLGVLLAPGSAGGWAGGVCRAGRHGPRGGSRGWRGPRPRPAHTRPPGAGPP